MGNIESQILQEWKLQDYRNQNKLIMQITRGEIIKNEAHILKGRYASLLDACEELKDTKLM